MLARARIGRGCKALQRCRALSSRSARPGGKERAGCRNSNVNGAWPGQPWTQCRFATTERGGMYVFDRKAKKLQRNRAASSPNAATYDYLRDEVAASVVERVCDIARHFPAAVDVGCGRGHVAKLMSADLIDSLCQCDMAEQALAGAGSAPDVATRSVVADEEEALPFDTDTFDLATSSLSLHWVNDLPRALHEILRVLKPDAPLVGAIFAGDTLFELRCSFQLAEMEREGGFAPHVSPFTEMRDMGGLLSHAGFSLTTVDVDEIQVCYPSMFELMEDLKGMGENNCAWNRRHYLRRSTINAAAAIYKSMYGNKDDSVPATFQLLYFIGWKPHPSQAKPLQRGSGTVSMKDIGQLK